MHKTIASRACAMPSSTSATDTFPEAYIQLMSSLTLRTRQKETIYDI